MSVAGDISASTTAGHFAGKARMPNPDQTANLRVDLKDTPLIERYAGTRYRS